MELAYYITNHISWFDVSNMSELEAHSYREKIAYYSNGFLSFLISPLIIEFTKTKAYRYLKCGLLICIVATSLYNTFIPKPFKFEHFNNREEAQAYFDEHYPVGSDVNILLDDLKKVGAEYFLREEKIPPQDMGKQKDMKYDKVYISEYSSNWISPDPMGMYDLIIFINNDNGIVHIDVLRCVKFTPC